MIDHPLTGAVHGLNVLLLDRLLGNVRDVGLPGSCDDRFSLDYDNALSLVGGRAVHPFSWRQKFGGTGVVEIRRFKQLEEENAKLKRLVADLSLDKTMLQDVLRRKF